MVKHGKRGHIDQDAFGIACIALALHTVLKVKSRKGRRGQSAFITLLGEAGDEAFESGKSSESLAKCSTTAGHHSSGHL